MSRTERNGITSHRTERHCTKLVIRIVHAIRLQTLSAASRLVHAAAPTFPNLNNAALTIGYRGVANLVVHAGARPYARLTDESSV
jgi:hypothetical protein